MILSCDLSRARFLCITDAGDVRRGHVRSPYAGGKMETAGAYRAHGGYPPVPNDIGVHSPSRHNSPMEVTHQNMEASGDTRSVGGDVPKTGIRSPYVGEKRSFAHSAPSKLDGESSHEDKVSRVSRRHSFFYRNRESK